MRLRPLFLSLAVATTSAVLLAGCSGKPENSPAIRKRFADLDAVQKTVDTMTTEVQALREQVTRLSTENSELRASLPGNANQTTGTQTASVEALRDMLTGKASPEAIDPSVPAAPAIASTTTTTDLTDKPLAGSPTSTVAPAPAVAAAPAAPEAPKGFKNQTRRTESKPATATKTSTKKAADKAVASKPAAKAPIVTTSNKKSSKKGGVMVQYSGESLSSLASRYGTTPAAILKANSLPAGAVPSKGSRIFIP